VGSAQQNSDRNGEMLLVFSYLLSNVIAVLKQDLNPVIYNVLAHTLRNIPIGKFPRARRNLTGLYCLVSLRLAPRMAASQ